jgi:hypothetical protein
MHELMSGLVPGLPDEIEGRSWPAPRVCPSMRWRPCACFSTGAAAAGGKLLPPRRPDRDAGGPRDPPRADRSAPGRIGARGAEDRSGRRCARQVVLQGRGGARLRDSRIPGRGDLDLARAQGGALVTGGSSLARARPVRVPARPAEDGRLRDALKHDRKAKHLAAAAFIEATWSADEDGSSRSRLSLPAGLRGGPRGR